GHGGEADDASVALALHGPERGACAVETAGEAHVDHRVPVGVGDVLDPVVADDAGVVDQDVETAEVVGDPGDPGVDLGGVGHVDRVGAEFGVVSDCRSGLGEGFAVDVGQRDGGAFGGEPGGHGETQALRATGDGDDASVVAIHFSSAFV